jgi:hypothetical protein
LGELNIRKTEMDVKIIKPSFLISDKMSLNFFETSRDYERGQASVDLQIFNNILIILRDFIFQGG